MAPRVNKKTIEKYFDFVKDQAICKVCSHTLKINRIFNLKTHVLKVHKIKEDEFANGSFPKKVCRKQVIKIEISKTQLLRSYIGLVTEDSIPFHILNSNNLKNIIDPICHGLGLKNGNNFCLNSSNCKKALKEVSDNIRDSIKFEVKQRLLSLKIDSATRLSQNVFGISVQFINCTEIQSRTLGMLELKGAGAGTSSNLSTAILDTLTKYDINLSQIVSITSDNGANMVMTTNIVPHCSLFEDGHDTDDGNEIYLKNMQMFEDSSEVQLGEIQISRCAAHIAQLCALDVTRDAEIECYLLSCRNLVKFIKKPSNGYREIFELLSLTMPQLDCPTRWGSTYNMITSLHNAKDVLEKIDPIHNKSIDENFDFKNSSWEFVEAYCVAFQPLQSTIVKFQEEELHYGNFYAEWLKCKICTEKILQKDDETYVTKIAKKLLHSMQNRTTKLLSNESLISCLYLDPRFQHTLTQTQKQNAVFYLKKLYERIENINMHTEQENNTEMTPSSSLEIGQFSQKADEYLNEYLTHTFVPTTNKSIDIYTKIANLQLPFLRADSNVLQFWRDKQYSDPELYDLSNICFAVPTTQVTMERAFSSLKPILADSRNRTNHETLENILLVKLNAVFLDQAIEDLPLFEDNETD